MTIPTLSRRKAIGVLAVGIAIILVSAIAAALTQDVDIEPSVAINMTIPAPPTSADIDPFLEPPPDCNSITIAGERIAGTGVINGDGANNYIVGSDNDDTINGQGGDDCIVGKNGDGDTLTGGLGNDVCLVNMVAPEPDCETVVRRTF